MASAQIAPTPLSWADLVRLGAVPDYDANTLPGGANDATAVNAGVLGATPPAPAPVQGVLADPSTDPSSAAAPSASGGPIAPQGVLADPAANDAAPPAQPPPPLPSATPSAQGGVLGNGAPSAAPPPQDPAATLPTPPTWGKRGVVGDVLDNVFLHGAIQQTRANQYREKMADYGQQMQRRQFGQAIQLAASLPPGPERDAAMADPLTYAKNILGRSETRVLKPGETVQGGINGPSATAPVVGIDNGRGYSATPQGMTVSDKNTGPSYKVDGGVVTDTRGIDRPGQPTATIGQPVITPAGASSSMQTPPVAIAGQPAPANSTAPAGSGLPGALTTTAPAGNGGQQTSLPLQLNNPGAVKALPNGQQWAGQTGVDPKTGFAIFGDLQSGAMAAMKNLQAKSTLHGLNTVSSIIGDPQFGWAPAAAGNDVPAYVTAVSNDMGVKPDQQLDMSDPKVVAGFARAIFRHENGGQAFAQSGMTGGAGPAPQAVTTSDGQPVVLPRQGQAAGIPSISGPVTKGAQPRVLTPAEAQALGYSPGAVVERAADGTTKVQQPPEYGPAALAELRNTVLKSKEYEDFTEAKSAYDSMTAASRQEGGMPAYAMLDTFARAINPGAVARAGTIGAIKEAQGVPDSIKGYLLNWTGKGNLDPAIKQQILDVTRQFVNSRYSAVQRLNQGNAEQASRHGVDPKDITVDVGAPPAPFSADPKAPVKLSSTDPSADFALLSKGQLFVGPDGVTRRK